MHQDAEEVTSGYSTISSSKEEEYLSCHLANQNAAAMSASKVAKDNASSIPGLISSHGTRKDENQSAGKESVRTGGRSRQNNQDGSTKKALNDELNDAALANILETERFKHIKVHKNQLTIVPSPPEHIEMFRLQEVERYKNPDRPWVYFNGDGSSSIVAPVIKKKNQ